MKTTHTLLLGVSAWFLLSVAGLTNASARVNVDFEIGTPAPSPVVETRWAAPSTDAVWVGGHYHWVEGRWVWYPGYYTYPPHRGAVWVGDRYDHHGRHYTYHPGHWRG